MALPYATFMLSYIAIYFFEYMSFLFVEFFFVLSGYVSIPAAYEGF